MSQVSPESSDSATTAQTTAAPVIVREVEQDAPQPWTQRLLGRNWGTAFLWLLALAVVGYLGFLEVVAWSEFSPNRAKVSLPLVASITLLVMMGWLKQTLQARRRVQRWWRDRIGDRYTQFVELSARGVTSGIRGVHTTTCAWGVCDLVWQSRRLHIAAGNTPLPIVFDDLSLQQRRQIHYWHQQATGPFQDICPDCQYDLRGSPGPQCPECGKPVRIHAPIDDPAPRVT